MTGLVNGTLSAAFVPGTDFSYIITSGLRETMLFFRSRLSGTIAARMRIPPPVASIRSQPPPVLKRSSGLSPELTARFWTPSVFHAAKRVFPSERSAPRMSYGFESALKYAFAPRFSMETKDVSSHSSRFPSTVGGVRCTCMTKRPVPSRALRACSRRSRSRAMSFRSDAATTTRPGLMRVSDSRLSRRTTDAASLPAVRRNLPSANLFSIGQKCSSPGETFVRSRPTLSSGNVQRRP